MPRPKLSVGFLQAWNGLYLPKLSDQKFSRAPEGGPGFWAQSEISSRFISVVACWKHGERMLRHSFPEIKWDAEPTPWPAIRKWNPLSATETVESIPSTATFSSSFSPEAVTDVARLQIRDQKFLQEIRIPFADRESLLFAVLHDCSSSDATWKVKPVFVGVCTRRCTWEELTHLNTFACLSGLANTQQQWVQFKGLYWCKTIYKNSTGDVFSGTESTFYFLPVDSDTSSQIDVKRSDNAYL